MQILDSTDQNELSFIAKVTYSYSWMIFIEDPGHLFMNDFFEDPGHLNIKI